MSVGLGPILDGLMRNTPDALAFIERAERDGVRSAIADRDGPFGDYSQGPPENRPDPGNVIEPYAALRARAASSRPRRTPTVVSQSMHLSVTDWP